MRVDASNDALKQALDVAAARHSLLASNLANLNTPGYERVDLDFDAALKAEGGNPMAHEIRGGSPDLVQETGSMAVTDSFYTACARILAMRYQLQHLPLKER
jgi:flagellar basal-body rod protein FlgB